MQPLPYHRVSADICAPRTTANQAARSLQNLSRAPRQLLSLETRPGSGSGPAGGFSTTDRARRSQPGAVYARFTHDLHAVYARFTRGLHAIYMRFVRNLNTVCTQFTHGLHAIYTRFTRGLHTIYMPPQDAQNVSQKCLSKPPPLKPSNRDTPTAVTTTRPRAKL